ncbi:EF-hand domain-containing protein [Caulobacter hibisci]|uniref:EF-hand domain-containing protein n=1 Tax=Caulobacter hibisci TaxID=2035993 RepID=A0ABS0T154_9CAUL|nr:hypothetical protein [Caulobacter hibisci]MBI1685409.1 hypothetical protein [Caulobacter hibisci]
MTARALPFLAIAALSLAACASGPSDGPPGGPQGGPGGRPGFGPPPGEGGPRGPGGPGGGGKQVFISPAGEPFRAEGGQPYPVAAWFAGADADHDGALTKAEFVADSLRFFDRLDTDKSGVLDGFEVSTYERTIAPEIVQASAMPQQAMEAPSGGEDGGPGGDGPRRRPNGLGNMLLGATPFALLAEPQPVMGADADFNRRVTRDEEAKAAASRFKLLDKDGDGRLTLAELPKTAMQKILDGEGDDRGGKGGRGRGRGGPPPRG